MDESLAPIYLDHNATAPVHPVVVETMLSCLREHFGNPSSGHVYGQRAPGDGARSRGRRERLTRGGDRSADLRRR